MTAGRIILGIVVGYMVVVVWVMATSSLVWKALGADFAFEPGTTRVTPGWMAVNLPLSFVGAYLGGSFAMRFGRERGTVAARGLAVMILVLGLGAAVANITGPDSAPAQATVDMSSMAASSQAIPPVWYDIIIPFIGAAGAMLGGRRRPSE